MGVILLLSVCMILLIFIAMFLLIKWTIEAKNEYEKGITAINLKEKNNVS